MVASIVRPIFFCLSIYGEKCQIWEMSVLKKENGLINKTNTLFIAPIWSSLSYKSFFGQYTSTFKARETNFPSQSPLCFKEILYYCSVINHRVRKKIEKRCMYAKNVTEKRSPKRKDSFVFACVSCLKATQIQF